MTPSFDRATALDRLGSERFDVVVIGGGVTGAGVALDAAARRLTTAIVERHDWASGTSSKSSKLVHGGLRYLQQNEYRLVYENLAERQRLLRNAPHLVRELPFVIPLFGSGGVVSKSVAKAYSSALWLYDLTGGWRIGKRHHRISREEALRHLPTLKPERLSAAFVYYDAQADDARLTLALVRTAALDHGAVAANYSPVVGVAKQNGRAAGVELADGRVVRARAVVNAAGVWADDVRSLDEGRHPDTIRPAKGVHVTVPAHRLPAELAVVLPVPKARRSIFVIPWGELTYIGTTDTDYDGPLDDPQCSAADIAYLLGAVNAATTSDLNGTDVVGTWAGLRPLLKGAPNERTADLSRRHSVSVSASGVVSVTGGKLTTYRKMAADAVDAVVGLLGSRRRSPTKRLALRGATLVEPGDHLGARYGGEAPLVAVLMENKAQLGEPLVAGLPYVRAEAVWAVREEMALTLSDVLERRTRALLLARDATAAAAENVARLIAPELGWSAEDLRREVDAFRVAVARSAAAAVVA